MSESFETIDDLRAAVRAARDEAKKLASHLKRMLDEYGDFEDRINAIDQAICEAEKELNLSREEILNPPTVIDDLLGDLG
jgi:chromosome segregation ATPase